MRFQAYVDISFLSEYYERLMMEWLILFLKNKKEHFYHYLLEMDIYWILQQMNLMCLQQIV